MIGGEKIILTTDGWTSLDMEVYLTVTAQCIDKEWELRDIILNMKEAQYSPSPHQHG